MDLPFPNNVRHEHNTYFGRRLGRKRRNILILLIFSVFFVLWFNSGYTETLKDNKIPDIIQTEQETEQELIQIEQDIQDEIQNEVSHEFFTGTMAKLLPQHYKYFIVIGSRAPQSSRRQLIRSTYFGINDNIEPCMKRDKGVGYLFYIYGDEPTPKTPERRAYETEKMEYNDLEKIDSNQFNQDEVLRWVNEQLRKRGVTFDYLIVQDGYSIMKLDYIQEQIQSQVSKMADKAETDLVWVSAKNSHQAVIVTGSEALGKLFDKEQFIINEKDMPLMSQFYEFYHSIEIQLKFVTETREVVRLQKYATEAPLFIDEQDSFQSWNNVIERLPDTTVAVSNVYQDGDFVTISRNLNLGVSSLCNSLEKPTIAVLTSSFIYADSCMEPSASLAADNKREYANKHNYAFVARSDEFAQQQLRTTKRRTVWGKIDAVQKVLPKYDWIFWMDMDAVIMDQEKTVQGILDELRHQYEGGPRMFEKNIDLVIAKPNRDKMINAGVFFLRNTEWAQSFLNKVQETTEWFNRGPSYEQGAMWDIIQLPGFREHVLLLDNDDHTFNTFPSLYNPGDFIVHFAPDKCPGPAVLNGLEAAKRIQQGEIITSFKDI